MYERTESLYEGCMVHYPCLGWVVQISHCRIWGPSRSCSLSSSSSSGRVVWAFLDITQVTVFDDSREDSSITSISLIPDSVCVYQEKHLNYCKVWIAWHHVQKDMQRENMCSTTFSRREIWGARVKTRSICEAWIAKATPVYTIIYSSLRWFSDKGEKRGTRITSAFSIRIILSMNEHALLSCLYNNIFLWSNYWGSRFQRLAVTMFWRQIGCNNKHTNTRLTLFCTFWISTTNYSYCFQSFCLDATCYVLANGVKTYNIIYIYVYMIFT